MNHYEIYISKEVLCQLLLEQVKSRDIDTYNLLFILLEYIDDSFVKDVIDDILNYKKEI